MSSDLRIAVLTVGVILIAAAVVASLLRMAGRGSALAGAGPRLLMGLAGVALVVWGGLAAHFGPSAAIASVSPAAPQAGAASPAGASPAGLSPSAPSSTAPSGTAASPGAAAIAPAAAQPAQPVQPDVIVLAGSAFDGCAAPKQPVDPPDGATATRAQMLVSHTQTQAFDTATDVYLACLDKAANDFDRQYGRVLNSNGLRQVEVLHTRIHNAAVDIDQAVATKFNRQLRVYKAHGGAS